MRIMFVYWRIGNAGSAQDIIQYARVAESLGHEVVMYAPEEPGSPFKCSLDLAFGGRGHLCIRMESVPFSWRRQEERPAFIVTVLWASGI